MLYEYKNNQYEKISDGKLKNPKTGEWIKCVNYKPVKGRDVVYTRVSWDFYDKFRKVKVST